MSYKSGDKIALNDDKDSIDRLLDYIEEKILESPHKWKEHKYNQSYDEHKWYFLEDIYLGRSREVRYELVISKGWFTFSRSNCLKITNPKQQNRFDKILKEIPIQMAIQQDSKPKWWQFWK